MSEKNKNFEIQSCKVPVPNIFSVIFSIFALPAAFTYLGIQA